MKKIRTSFTCDVKLLRIVDLICKNLGMKRSTFIEKSLKIGIQTFPKELSDGLNRIAKSS